MPSTACRNGQCRTPYWRVQLIPRAPDRSFAHANSTQSCPLREALLSSGLLCPESGTPFWTEAETSDFRDETVADRFGVGGHGGVCDSVRAAVAACARCRRDSGGTGRSGGTLGDRDQFCSAE